jgi:hypothetical protein
MSRNLPEHKPDLPDDMDLHFRRRWPADVPMVPWEQLTLDQKRMVIEANRFGGFVTGSYQAVSFNGKGNQMPP